MNVLNVINNICYMYVTTIKEKKTRGSRQRVEDKVPGLGSAPLQEDMCVLTAGGKARKG